METKNKQSKFHSKSPNNISKKHILKEYFVDNGSVSSSFIKNILNKVNETLNNELAIQKYSLILLAISGGIDSVVLLDIIFNISKDNNFKLHILHFNHQLRGDESIRDVKFVENLAKAYNCPFILASGNVKEYAIKNKLSIEHAARELRYEFYQRKAQSLSADFVATAHHSNDNTETFFINLFRGSGLTGLSGIPIKRELMKNIFLIRPLLNLTKDDIIKYAEFRKLQWVEDSTNQISLFRRNKIRLELIPNIEKNFSNNIHEVINRTSSIIREADNFIKEHIDYLLKFINKEKKGSKLVIKLNNLINNSNFIISEILQKIITDSYKINPINSLTIKRIIDLLNSETGTQIDVTNNIIAIKDRNEIVFFKDKETTTINKTLTKIGEFKVNDFILKLSEVSLNQFEINNSPLVEYLDYDLIDEVLELRNWSNGDSFIPIGMQIPVKISDFLTNKKISAFDKRNVLVLSSNNEIIWVLKYRISDKFKVTENTNRILKCEIIQEIK